MKRWMRAGLATAGAAAAGLWYTSRVERTRITLNHFTVQVDRPGLPRRGLTILHLTDLHFGAEGAIQDAKIARLRDLLATESYDVVALTGDLIHDMAGFPAALDLVTSLRPRFAMYYCPGNHDYAEYTPWGVLGQTWREGADGPLTLKDIKRAIVSVRDFARKVVRNELVRMPVCFNDVPAMIRELEANGVTALVNASTVLRADGVEVWFAGVDDEMESRPDLAEAFAAVPPGAALILLAHNPDIWLQGGVERADLILSGHTHGGQIQLPGMGAIHTQGTHLTRSRPAGWFQRGESRMFVSRGVGESIPLRFRAGPQAAIITLVPSPTRPVER